MSDVESRTGAGCRVPLDRESAPQTSRHFSAPLYVRHPTCYCQVGEERSSNRVLTGRVSVSAPSFIRVSFEWQVQETSQISSSTSHGLLGHSGLCWLRRTNKPYPIVAVSALQSPKHDRRVINNARLRTARTLNECYKTSKVSSS